ncbi:hypothetical protein AV530_004313 [Patagioenas fasciata monilis]|uniref:Uncharacterized protein n=1 Tax=Patagioenas fasciata monilis TaxID=372326 RepID=A0A1V4K901_PATFA|nr:hypothetical protein AV530_004313 [Patagioenas fasciata monilis]
MKEAAGLQAVLSEDPGRWLLHSRHNIHACLKTNRRPADGRQDSEDDFSTNATDTILEFCTQSDVILVKFY